MTRANMLGLKFAVAILISLATYLTVEFGYRWYFYRSFLAAEYGITIVDANIFDATSIGYYKPKTTFHWRQFDAEHNVLFQCQVTTNNHGFISARDYQFDKPPGEFRIALVGDSLTACITNDVPWADILERELNGDVALKQRLGANSVRALNFGAPGAGFHTMALVDRDRVSAYAPDLVIVNYIEEDFPREGAVNLLNTPPRPKEAESNDLLLSFVHVQEARIQLIGAITDESRRRYSDPLQIPEVSPSSMFVVEDDAVTFDKARIAGIKRELAQRYLSKRVWRSLHPHALYRVLGRPFSLSYADRMAATLSLDVNRQVDHAIEGIRDIQSRRPHVILLRNPLIQDLDGRPIQQGATRLLEQRAPDLKIVRMEKYLPVERGQKDIYTWFNLPHDGHFSNYGAEIYARAVHDALCEHLTDASDGPRPLPRMAGAGDEAARHRQ